MGRRARIATTRRYAVSPQYCETYKLCDGCDRTIAPKEVEREVELEDGPTRPAAPVGYGVLLRRVGRQAGSYRPIPRPGGCFRIADTMSARLVGVSGLGSNEKSGAALLPLAIVVQSRTNDHPHGS
jgi:hypothetical protein